MLDNDKLNRRLKKIFNELKLRWGITPYRIAVETGIPHSSLKYMSDKKFEWKLNHLLAVIDFLNRYGARVSLTNLLDFSEKKSLTEIMDIDKSDFREVYFRKRTDIRKFRNKELEKKREEEKRKLLNPNAELDAIVKDITNTIKESYARNFKDISVKLKITGKNIDFKKNIDFSNGKIVKK